MATLLKPKVNPTPTADIQANGINGHWLEEDPPSLDGMPVSEEQYWEEYYLDPDRHYEWNNGILEEKPMADVRNSLIYQWFLMLLRGYLRVHPIASVINLEIGFRLKLPHKTTIRKPDIFIVRHDNPAPLLQTDATFRGICDLCIESLSDSSKKEIERDTVQKKAEYAQVGVREYFIIHTTSSHTAFYQRTSTGVYAPIPPTAAGVIRSNVLPGFQFRLTDLYAQPTDIELAEDPVYSAFMLPEYQAMKQRAEEERLRAAEEYQRAEQARQRAEEERQRAEEERLRAEEERQRAEQAEARALRYAAKLRELGLPADDVF